MKNLIRFFACAFAALTLFSCGVPDKEDTYVYISTYAGNIYDEDRAEQLVSYLNSACDGYFSVSHSYTGLQSQTMQDACLDFTLNCNALNEDIVCSFLEYGEELYIYLIDKASGNYLMYCTFYSKQQGPDSSGDE